jgi:nucleotide-binding universal stress UspA family protein
MTANTIERPQSEVTTQSSLRADPWILTGPVLVATDGTEASDAALRVADGIARDHGLFVHAISVLEPLSSIFAPVDGLMVALPPTVSDATRMDVRLTTVRERVRKTVRPGDAWGIQVRIGPIAATLVAVAREMDASLIVLGLGKHRPVDRLLGDEIAAQVVRRASIPVLVVPSNATVPLRRAVVGIDFSRASIRAARAAVSLTTPPGHVWLAHVKPPLEIPSEAYEGALVIYTQGVLSTFKKIEERLEAVELLEVRPVVLEGRVADELLAFGASHHADLLVTGAHGRTLVERLLIGSVTTKVLRAAQCAVLVIPPYREDREPRT